MSNSRTLGCGSHRAKTMVKKPMANDPVTLMVNVADGNFGLAHWFIQCPSQYRALTPITPPIDRARIFHMCSITRLERKTKSPRKEPKGLARGPTRRIAFE